MLIQKSVCNKITTSIIVPDDLHDAEDQDQPHGEGRGKTARDQRVHDGLKNEFGLGHVAP